MGERKTACVTIGGRAIALCLNMAALERIDARFGSFEQMLDELGKPETERGMIIDVAVILACGAQEMADETPDVTADWLRRHMRPGELVRLSRAIGEGMRREEDDPGENEPQDVVLEELEAKKNSAR